MSRFEFTRLSASSVKAFQSCPYAYALQYIRRVPSSDRIVTPAMALGQAVHAAIADFHRRGGWRVRSKAQLIEELDRHWQSSAFVDESGSEVYREQADAMLLGLAVWRRWRRRSVNNPAPRRASAAA